MNDVAFRQLTTCHGTIENCTDPIRAVDAAGALPGILRERRVLAGRPFVGARPAVCVDLAQKCRTDRWIDPALADPAVTWVQRETLDEVLSAGLRRTFEHLKCGQGASGLT